VGVKLGLQTVDDLFDSLCKFAALPGEGLGVRLSVLEGSRQFVGYGLDLVYVGLKLSGFVSFILTDLVIEVLALVWFR